MAKISATLQLGEYPSRDDLDFCIDLSHFVIRKVYQPLDFPSPDADPLIAGMFCTPPDMRNYIMQAREGYAKHIADTLVHYILTHLSGLDTEMGYNKKEAVPKMRADL